jgi:hypothetical protein
VALAAGISYTEFWELTPSEVFDIVYGYQEMKESDYEMMAHAFRIALINAYNNKNFSVFAKNNQNKLEEISEEEHKEAIKKLEEFPDTWEVK